jgi:2-keto-4-pentenoate hydratase
MQSTTVLDEKYRPAAEALWNARASHVSVPPLRQWLDPTDLAGAYAIQLHNNERRTHAGARIVGRKIGLTSQSVQRQLGVYQPDFGLLFDDMLFEGGSAAVPTDALLQPRIEGEIAFVMQHDVTESGCSRPQLAEAAGSATAAFEIVDSAIAEWKITLADTVADNASCGALVLSSERRPVRDLDLRLAGMVMSEDSTIVSLGVGAASLGDPLAALEWLANLAIEQGQPLRRGEIVLAGALGPMVPFVQGRRYTLEIAGFTRLEVHAK